MLPHHFVCRRICIHFTFKVHVISFLDVFRVHIRPQLQLQRGQICNDRNEEKQQRSYSTRSNMESASEKQSAASSTKVRKKVNRNRKISISFSWDNANLESGGKTILTRTAVSGAFSGTDRKRKTYSH